MISTMLLLQYLLGQEISFWHYNNDDDDDSNNKTESVVVRFSILLIFIEFFFVFLFFFLPPNERLFQLNRSSILDTLVTHTKREK